MDLLLPQCTVVYAPKDSKRKHHELRFTLPNGDALVLAVQSKEQAHRWLRVRLLQRLFLVRILTTECLTVFGNHVQIFPQVVREVSGQNVCAEESVSPIIPRKAELDKVGVAASITSTEDIVNDSLPKCEKERWQASIELSPSIYP